MFALFAFNRSTIASKLGAPFTPGTTPLLYLNNYTSDPKQKNGPTFSYR